MLVTGLFEYYSRKDSDEFYYGQIIKRIRVHYASDICF